MQTIVTKYGTLIPQHTTDDLRRKDLIPVEYHANGTPKAIPLERQTILATPAGNIPAELVTFHENGNINRIFPLNGKLSGYWTQGDESDLAEPVTFVTPIGAFTTTVISLGFYDNGNLLSITLWPGETVSVETPIGHIETRIGVSFTEKGSILSIEPAKPTTVKTAVGEILAYDPDAIGISGDNNSLVLNSTGDIQRFRTTQSSITVISPEGRKTEYAPQDRESYCSEEAREITPMTVEFGRERVLIKDSATVPAVEYPLPGYTFLAKPYLPQLEQAFGIMSCSM